MIKRNGNNSNFSTYQQSLFNKYEIDETYLQTRKQRKACLELLEKIDNNEAVDEDKLIKKVANAFRNTVLHKRVASCMTLAALMMTLQSAPVMAKSVSDYNALKQSTQITQQLQPADELNGVYLDQDSFLNKTFAANPTGQQTQIQSSSIHLLKGKPIKNDYTPIEENGVLVDGDSDISFYQKPEAKALTVIDTGIEDWEAIKEAVPAGEILLLDNEAPLDAIIAKLKEMGEVDTLNILSHGSSGSLNFTNGAISIETLEKDKAKWEEIGKCLSEDGDIQLYGCNVAQGSQGNGFIKKMAELTHADIAASINPTGASIQGGDWDLEVAVGDINTNCSGVRLPDQAFKHLLSGLQSGKITFEDSSIAVTSEGFTYKGLKFTKNGGFQFKLNYSNYYNTVDSDGMYSSNDKVLYTYDVNWKNSTANVTIESVDGTEFSLKLWIMATLPDSGDTIIKGYKNDAPEPVGIKTTGLKNFKDTVNVDFTSPDSGSFSDIDKFVIRSSGGGNSYGFVMDDMVIQIPDATITAGTAVTEPVAIPTTATSTVSSVPVFDFKITDNGTKDTLSTNITKIKFNTSGTGDFSKITWILSGPDSANVVGTYDAGTKTLTFGGLNISVENAGNETYTVRAITSYPTEVIEGATYILEIDAVSSTNFTVSSTSSQIMSNTIAINNGTGSKVDVTATKLMFETQPGNSTSGSYLMTQPVVKAVDVWGNIDKDFTGNITLTENSAGSLSGTTMVGAVAGIANFNTFDLTYTATADQENFQLTAASSGLTSAVSNSVTSDVVATKLVFQKQPVPTTIQSGQTTSFTTVPVVQAVDGAGTLDTGYVSDVVLSITDPGDAVVNGTVNSLTATVDEDGSMTTVTKAASGGVASFDGLSVNYTANGSSDSLAFYATSGTLNYANSSTISVSNIPVVTSVVVPANGAYKAGDSLIFTVNFSIPITIDSAGGTPRIPLTLNTGGTVYATYISGSGSSQLVFGYTMAAGNEDTDGITLGEAIDANGGTLRNSDVDAILALNSVGATTGVLVDAVGPTVSSVSATAANGAYKAGDTIGITVEFNEAVTVTGTPQLILETGTTDRTINYTGGNGTSTLTFTYTVQAGDTASDLDYISTTALSLNGGTITDNAGNDAVLTLPSPGATGSLSGNKAIVIDTVVPAEPSTPYMTAASDTGSSNTDRVTKQTRPTFKGTAEAGSTVKLYKLGTTPGSLIELGSATAASSGNWSITPVSPLGEGVHKINAQAIDAAGNVSANPHTLTVWVDTTAPTVTLSHNDSDDKVKKGDTVTITALFNDFVTNPRITIEHGGVTDTAMTAVLNPEWEYIWNVPEGNGVANVTLDAEDIAGNAYVGTQILSFNVDSIAPAITSGTLATDNSYIDITFGEGVYGANDGVTAVTSDKLALTFIANAGNATAVNIQSVKKNDSETEASASALTGGETVIRVFLDVTGLPSGVETIEIKPANATVLFDSSANAVSQMQTTTAKTLNDKKLPSVVALSPSDNTVEVASNTDLKMTFDEAVKVGSGNIMIKKASDNSVVESINVTSSQVTGDGTGTITVNPTVALTPETGFYVQMDGSALKDVAGNAFAGIWDTTTWNFTTVALSTTKAITSFKFEQLSSTVTASVYESTKEIIAIVPWGTDVSALDPTITHTGVSITPNSGVSQNFNHAVSYKVTAQDQTSQNYTVSVVVAPPNALLAPGVTSHSGNKQVIVSWDKVEAATAYQLFQRTAANAYGSAAMTVTDSVYSQTFTGLENGTTYYFVIKAVNGTVESTYSNEVSATPMTVPNAATNVVAIAGNGQAVVSFNAPQNNGGSVVTKYTVTAYPGGITAEGIGSPMTVIGLTNGTTYTFTVTAENSEGKGEESAPSNAVIPKVQDSTQPTQPSEPSDSSDSSDSSGSSDSSVPTTPTGIEVIINGKPQTAGTETVTQTGGINTVELKTDATVLSARIEQVLKEIQTAQTAQNVVEIPVAVTNADVIRSILTGDIINKMAQNDFNLIINTANVDYIIPAKEIGIAQVAATLGVNETSLQKIEIAVEIKKLNDKQTNEMMENAKKQGYDIVFAPVEFKVVARTTMANGEVKETEVEKFSSYVTRVMEIPKGIDPSKITTGIVYNTDGTFSHVPTVVFEQNGKWYAKVNSLTNSSYAVISNPIAVTSVSNHWSKLSVNDMAERLVIDNITHFEPDAEITRGEFAEYITKAIGVYRTGVANQKKFTDVETSSELADAITIATQYNIIAGYPDGSFKPDATITREEAMAMYARAMDIIHLEAGDLTRIEKYTDKMAVSNWAYEAVQKTIGAGVFNGNTASTLAPQGTFTYAEAATAIRNLLVEAELINK